MTSLLPIIVMAATVCATQGIPYSEEISSEIDRAVFLDGETSLPPHLLNKRYADPQQPSTIIESDEPADRILMRFSKGEDVAELVDGDYQVRFY
ncbi:uncharacterized protein [Halyomorpha halys]|uniref:uncharacterized protein n=1 Tax=Halyomorpha halys TaxID=286706 RepID=UPI0034D1A0EC